MRVQMLGLCRFSYVGLRGYQVEHDSYQERRAHLYDPDRLARRWFWFSEVALPAWRAQTDPDFTFLILVGDSLPDAYLDRLRALVADFPQARIVARPPGPHRQVCQEVINAARDMNTPCLEFPHDDDDAVAVLDRTSAGLVRRATIPVGDSPHGLALVPVPGGRPRVFVALAGEDGVSEVIRGLMSDFELNLRLAGGVKPSDIDASWLVPAP
mgnify:CR=1 FL=1